MANPYTSVTVSGYNANPPADDGSETEANRVKWSTIKSKLPDPLKTALESIDANVTTAFGKMIGGGGLTTTAISYQVASTDQGKLVRATASGVTLTTPDATDVDDPFMFGVLNNSSGDITLDGSGSQTINGSATLTMKSGDGWLVMTDGTNWFVIGRKTGILPRGYIDGCILANGTDATNDINVAAGVCRDSTNAVDITVAAMAGKQLDANWVPGAAAGMRNSAAGIANATYFIYAVQTAAGVQDIYAHTSATVATVITALQAESGGSLYIYARRIGSILRESATIVAFTQVGDYFRRSASIQSINDTGVATTGLVQRILNVPVGLKIMALFNAQVNNTGQSESAYFFDPAASSEAPSRTVAPGVSLETNNVSEIGAAQFEIMTDTSARINSRVRVGDGNTALRISTLGWTDTRGRDA